MSSKTRLKECYRNKMKDSVKSKESKNFKKKLNSKYIIYK